MPERIYLDNNATAPLDPRIGGYLAEMLPLLDANPSSVHAAGRRIKALIAQARDSIAAFLNVKSREVLFTSGGTEGINMAIRGLAEAKPRSHIITSSAEHACVIACCRLLEAAGHNVTYLSPGTFGAVTPGAVEAALQENTSMIILMAVNNETGVKTDVDAIAKLAEKRGVSFVVDAVALLGKEAVVIPRGVTAMAFSGHKLHALQGSGILFMRAGVKVAPLIVGGEHEFGRRAGTENVLGILSLGKAIELLAEEGEGSYEAIRRCRDRFEEVLKARLSGVKVNGDGPRTSNVSNLAFTGVDGETLLMALDRAGICASHGSACSSGALEPSRVLLAMGLPLDRVRSSIRFSFSRLNSEQEVEEACEVIIRTVLSL